MSELRWHPFLEEWVITATHRQGRTFMPPDDYCPLCPTKPGKFPTEVPKDDYDIVVFENKFPSLKEFPPEPCVNGLNVSPIDLAKGICEVVLYSPDHSGSLAKMPLRKIHNLIQVWQDRYSELGAKNFIKYVYIFENKGEAVGVTLSHPHGQIYAFPFIPSKIERELTASRKYKEAKGSCLFCDTLADEFADGRRIVVEGERFIAFIPFFARYPYETYIAPKRHLSSMAEFTVEDHQDLALVMKALLLKYDNIFGFSFPYIMAVHQSPTDGENHDYYHLHFEFYPPHRTITKLKYLAGCEAGAGNFINDTLAEEKAKELREIAPLSLDDVLAMDNSLNEGLV